MNDSEARRYRHNRPATEGETRGRHSEGAVRQEAESANPGQKEIRTAVDRGERRQSGDLLPDRPPRDGHVVRAILRADERVAFVTQFVKPGIVRPHVLRELEL